MRNYTSDHFSIRALLLRRPTYCHNGYLQGRREFLLNPPPTVELIKVGTKFQTLKTFEPAPPMLKRPPHFLWMSPESIQLIYKRASLHQRGKGSHQIHPTVPYGGLFETSRGGSHFSWGMSGAFHRRERPPRNIRHNETLVLACIRTGAQPLPDGYGECQEGLPDPLSEGGATPPWPVIGNTHGYGPGELQYPIIGEGGDSST